MAVTCSEGSLRSLQLVIDQHASNLTPIHTIEASWPLHLCPIETQLSRERALTLLEKHTLLAFNEIEGVSAAEIAENLGLFEPMLIEEALTTLQNSGAIESDIDNPDTDQTEGQLRDELRLIDEKIASGSYGHQRMKDLSRKRRVLRGRISAIGENSSGIKQILTNAYNRLRGFTAILTDSGLANLRRGKITEPQKKEVLNLARIQPDGRIMTTRGEGFATTDFKTGRRNMAWSPVKTKSNFPPIDRDDVERALRQSGQLLGGLTIESIEELPSTEVHLHVHLTLCVNNDDNSPSVIVHLDKGGRLGWAEEIINSNKYRQEVMRKFKKEMPSATGSLVQCELARPLVQIPQYIRHQSNSSSASPVVARNRNKIFEVDGAEKVFGELLQQRTFIDLQSGKPEVARIMLTREGRGLFQFKVAMAKPPLPASGSIATIDGVIVRAKLEIQTTMPQGRSKKLLLPVFTWEEYRGQSIVHKISEVLRSGINSETAYAYTRREDDLQTWVDELVGESKGADDVLRAILKLQQESKGSGHNVYRMVMESLFQNKADMVSITGPMKLFEEIAKHESVSNKDLWQFLEPHIQQQVIRSSFSPDEASGGAIESWIKHHSSTELLPWEEAAKLEFSIFGHCDSTKRALNLRFESIVYDLSNRNGIYPDDLSSAISTLVGAGVIPEDLEEGCSRLRRERNRYSHEEGHSSGLESAESAISLVRRLQEISGCGDEDARFSQPRERKGGGPISREDLVSYLAHSSKIISDASGFGVKCNYEVWARVLIEGLPKEFNEMPEDLLIALHKAPELEGELQFSDLSMEVVDRAKESWIGSIPDFDRLEMNERVGATLDFLRGVGMEKSAKDLGGKIAAKAPLPKGMSDLLDEVADHNELEPLMTLPDLRSRWKKAVGARDFAVTADDLGSVKPKLMEPLGKVASALVKKTISSEVGSIETGDAESVIEVVSKLGRLGKQWREQLISQDGFLSDRASQKIRKGNDPEEASKSLKGGTPLHEDVFPKTNEALRQIEIGRKKGTGA